MPELGSFIQWLTFAGMLSGALIYGLSRYRRENHEELEALAKTRGDTIDDLRDEIEVLKETLANQQGQIDMLRAMKTQEIIDGVVEGIAAHPLFKV